MRADSVPSASYRQALRTVADLIDERGDERGDVPADVRPAIEVLLQMWRGDDTQPELMADNKADVMVATATKDDAQLVADRLVKVVQDHLTL